MDCINTICQAFDALHASEAQRLQVALRFHSFSALHTWNLLVRSTSRSVDSLWASPPAPDCANIYLSCKEKQLDISPPAHLLLRRRLIDDIVSSLDFASTG